MNASFVPLLVRSAWSLGRGTARVEDLAERAARLGLPGLALSDCENIYGQIAFHHAVRARGLRPITGATIELEHEYPLLLLAKNLDGYRSLCRAITRMALGTDAAGLRKRPPGPRPEDAIETIRGSKDLIVLATEAPVLERLLREELVPPGDVRALLIRPGPARREVELRETALRFGVPCAAATPVEYMDPSDAPLAEVRRAIHESRAVDGTRAFDGARCRSGAHFRSPAEMDGLFGDVPGALEETVRILELCELDLREAPPVFPRAEIAPGETPRGTLEGLARAGLRRRGRNDRAHAERLERELGVIDRLGFTDYFLVVSGVVALARSRGMEAVGRGSAAGSLVAHALGITTVDPVEHALCFERFLHGDRVHLPDIDIDLPWDRRDELIEEVFRLHGRDRVAMIACHDTFQRRSAIRDVLLALGSPPGEADLHAANPRAAEAIPIAERLLGLPRAVSVHAGGIVIADRPLDAFTPLELAAKGVVITQLDMKAIECVGLVKIDLLGNRCLSEIQATLDLVSARCPLDENGSRIRTLESIPDRDPATLSAIESARTVGCFQIETPAMRSVLGRLPIRSVNDLTAALAILRPGAASSDAKETYIRRAAGEEESAGAHPLLDRVLEETHGVILYEEDILRIASAATGMTLEEGDLLRTAVRNARDPGTLGRIRNGFIADAAFRGIGEEASIAIWGEMEKFAAYSFSKAHASGYALLAYQSAYLKTHYPVEFFAAVLEHHGGMYSRRTLAWEAMRSGIRILAPSVNLSGPSYRVEGEPGSAAIRSGLCAVKGVSRATIESILRARREGGPFRSISDYLSRVQAPIGETESLLLVGALDELGDPGHGKTPLNRPQLLWELETLAAPARCGRPRPRSGGFDAGAPDIFSLFPEGPRTVLVHPPLTDYTPLERARLELRFLEMAITDHPLRILRPLLEQKGAMKIRKALERQGGRIRVAGLVAARREAMSRTGPMEFITIEDDSDLLEVVLFPKARRFHGGKITALGPYIFEGELRRERRSVHLDVRDVAAVAPRRGRERAGLTAAGEAPGEAAARAAGGSPLRGGLPGRGGGRRG